MYKIHVVNFWQKTAQDEKQKLSGTGKITISQDDLVIITHTTFWHLVTLCWFLQLLYLLISEFFGFILSLHQLNLGVSNNSTNIDTGILQPDDSLFQQAGSVLKEVF